MFVESQRVHI